MLCRKWVKKEKRVRISFITWLKRRVRIVWIPILFWLSCTMLNVIIQPMSTLEYSWLNYNYFNRLSLSCGIQVIAAKQKIWIFGEEPSSNWLVCGTRIMDASSKATHACLKFDHWYWSVSHETNSRLSNITGKIIILQKKIEHFTQFFCKYRKTLQQKNAIKALKRNWQLGKQMLCCMMVLQMLVKTGFMMPSFRINWC